MGVKGMKWIKVGEERELNPKIKEKAKKVADTVKGIDGAKVLTMVVGGAAAEIVKNKIKQ